MNFSSDTIELFLAVLDRGSFPAPPVPWVECLRR